MDTPWISCLTLDDGTAALLPTLPERIVVKTADRADWGTLANRRFLHLANLPMPQACELAETMLGSPRSTSLPIALHVLEQPFAAAVAAREYDNTEYDNTLAELPADVLAQGVHAARERLALMAGMGTRHAYVHVQNGTDPTIAARVGEHCAVLCGNAALLIDLIAYHRIRGWLAFAPPPQGLTEVA